MKQGVWIRVGVGTAIVVGAAALLLLRSDRGRLGDMAFYYDLSEGRLYEAAANQPLPHAGIGGAPGDGVLAVVYTCGDRRDAGTRQIAYLQTFTPELSAAFRLQEEATQRHEPGPPELQDRAFLTSNTLVRRVDDPEWHAIDSPQGQEALRVLTTPCADGTYPKVCSPTD